MPANVICDKGVKFWRLADKSGITIEKPYYHHNGKDPPQLLNSFQNHFCSHSILFGKSANRCSVKTLAILGLYVYQNYKPTHVLGILL